MEGGRAATHDGCAIGNPSCGNTTHVDNTAAQSSDSGRIRRHVPEPEVEAIKSR